MSALKTLNQVEQNIGAVGWDISGGDLKADIRYFKREELLMLIVSL